MIGQQSISKFFSPLGVKRSASSTCEKVESPTLKKSRDDINILPQQPKTPENKKNENHENQSCSLSPEQKVRMDRNRLSAMMKLCGKQSFGLVENVGLSWFQVLEKEFSKPYFTKLGKFVQEERLRHTVYPPVNQVFSWTQMSDVNDIKVVILGQDPYHGPNQAHGLCFSVQKNIPPPPSLVNMFKELKSDIPGFVVPGHGDLTGWAKQGVLLLNAVLTVKANNANSHKDRGWEKFTDAVISYFNQQHSGIIFLLWGSYAQKKGSIINKKKHHVLTGVHPSPLSAYRGYFGCKHFSKTNELLKQQNKMPIDWTSLP